MYKKVIRHCDICWKPVVTEKTFTSADRAEEWEEQINREGVTCSKCSGWSEFERNDKKRTK